MDITNLILGGTTTTGFAALIYFTFNFMRATGKDTLQAYSDLYDKASSRCDELELQLKEERLECDTRINALEIKFEKLMLLYQQQGQSTAALFDHRTEPRGI